ncbi:hypothetical protein WG904_19405 [Pedobacter sp. Du54]|uniref:hypothetical protein n=1 Tax=Pedobacter anseongensis TaxID=3133439 RepID=UPI0030B6B8F5
MEKRQRQAKTHKNTTRTVIIAALSVIILSNTPPAQFFLLENYHYQNADGSFQYSEEPGKGMDFKAGLIQFDGWKRSNPQNNNILLYRTFHIRPWQFWEWWQYIAHNERYRLPILTHQ